MTNTKTQLLVIHRFIFSILFVFKHILQILSFDLILLYIYVHINCLIVKIKSKFKKNLMLKKINLNYTFLMRQKHIPTHRPINKVVSL